MNDLDDALPDFRGKLVLVLFNGPGEHNKQLLHDPHFERLGGRLFLVGTIPPKVVTGIEGNEVAVAWDVVNQYLVLDSLKHYRDGCITQQRESSRAKWRRPVSWLYGDG